MAKLNIAPTKSNLLRVKRDLALAAEGELILIMPEPDAFRGRHGRRFHELADGVKHHFELFVVTILQFVKALGQILVGRQQFPETDECAHDGNVDLDGARTPQYAGKHGNTLLGKNIRQLTGAAPT